MQQENPFPQSRAMSAPPFNMRQGNNVAAMVQTGPEEHIFDSEKYVKLAAQAADDAKLSHRATLKELQRGREENAHLRGRPLSAKDKERERSRRESAVTRKRSEVYIHELERAARKVPELEREVLILRQQLRAIHYAVRQHGLNSKLPRELLVGVKEEPGLSISPNSTGSSRVTSGFENLDLYRQQQRDEDLTEDEGTEKYH